MKRLTSKARLRRIRLIRKKFRRVKKKRRGKLKVVKVEKKWVQITAPIVFSVQRKESRRKFLRFIKRFRAVYAVDKRWLIIDFSRTQKMIADGTLIFFAELSRLLRLTAGLKLKIRCIPPHNDKVAQVLKQVGLLDLLNCRKKIEPTFTDVIHWRSASGQKVIGEKYDSVLKNYDGRIADALKQNLYCGLTEAMTNSLHHAYIHTRPDGLNAMNEPSDWWMFSQEKEGMLTVVFCDLGIGIPGSLPEKQPNVWERVRTTFFRDVESHAIQEAIAYSKTRTGKSHRGKGLKQLVDVVSNVSGGKVKIFSNKGCFTLDAGQEIIYDYKDSILGTLIYWSLPIGGLPDDTVKD